MKLKHALAKAIGSVSPAAMRLASKGEARKAVSVSNVSRAIEIRRRSDGAVIRLSAAQAMYLPDMINFFPYYFDSVRPVLMRRTDGSLSPTVDFSTPRLHWVAGFDDFPVLFPSLAEPFVTTEQYLDFAGLKPGAIALDLGCYCALSSIAFSKAVGASGRVVAVEPDPFNRLAAEENIAAHRRVNRLDNIDLLAAAVADRAGHATFSSEGAMGSAMTSIVGGYRGDVVEVECVTLQDIADRHGLARVDFVKIDIEGAEEALILASGAFLTRYRPRLIIEPHPLNGRMTTEPMIAFLTSLGYRSEVIEQTGLSWPLLTAVPPAVAGAGAIGLERAA